MHEVVRPGAPEEIMFRQQAQYRTVPPDRCVFQACGGDQALVAKSKIRQAGVAGFFPDQRRAH